MPTDRPQPAAGEPPPDTSTRPTDFEMRFPLISARGRRGLEQLQAHPHAPRYTHLGCDRMTAAGLQRAAAFEQAVQLETPQWQIGETPAWLDEFVARCYQDVPFYRRTGPPPASFFDLPLTGRADLNREPWAFVPDGQPLDDLIIYNTSGTTGHPLDILTHPDHLALYVPLLRAALGTVGLTLAGGAGRVAIALVCAQRRTYTYAAVSPLVDEGGFVKINLNPADWRDPADRTRYLDDCRPEVYTGDPLAFAELAKLPLQTRPTALISTAMSLLPGLKQALEAHFGCPALDVYSLNETGPVAVAVNLPGRPAEAGSLYRLLQPRLYVETLTAEGALCRPGERGEVVVSGGFNDFLPLLRYRTGDTARLEFQGRQPFLADLAGRPPVAFRGAGGQWLNNIDVSLALRDFPLVQYRLHQSADGALRLRVRGAGVSEAQLRAALLDLFGSDQPLTIEALEAEFAQDGKWVQYTSDLAQGPLTF
jgi:phenylacetate-CoA ligase